MYPERIVFDGGGLDPFPDPPASRHYRRFFAHGFFAYGLFAYGSFAVAPIMADPTLQPR